MVANVLPYICVSVILYVSLYLNENGIFVSSYFRSLIEQFEVQLQQYRQQIEELENHLTTQSSGSHITPQGKRTFACSKSERNV